MTLARSEIQFLLDRNKGRSAPPTLNAPWEAFSVLIEHLSCLWLSKHPVLREAVRAVTAVFHSCLPSLYLPPAITCGPQEINLSDLGPDCCKTFLDVRAMTLAPPFVAVVCRAFSLFLSFHHDWKRGEDGAVSGDRWGLACRGRWHSAVTCGEVGGGHTCPIPYQIKHILGISALEADAGVF